ncbi:MAG TPA: TetR/AcrR family transcriptional regulator [Jatrophihabitantaceae bacterium]|jgi:AcrR family transcriptional regulator|nr:TetR/AcrR family transcriptional regulator [Jatrophihabitantaceae bacterium]
MTAARLAGGRRGAGGLTPQQVTEHQRGRILLAMAEAVAAKGYPAVSVGDVIAAAGVSRATFYEQFADKQECFLAAFDAASERVMFAARPAASGAADKGGFDGLIAAYLDALVDAPGFARVFLVDISALGPEGIARRAAGQQRFARSVANLFGARTAADRFAAEALVAAIAGMVTTRVAAGDLDGVKALRGPIVELAGRLFPAGVG